jgi:hypothetical protein
VPAGQAGAQVHDGLVGRQVVFAGGRMPDIPRRRGTQVLTQLGLVDRQLTGPDELPEDP